MLAVKILEAIVRIVGGVSFDRSRHVVDSGLFGACGLLGCCGGPRKSSRRDKRSGKSSDRIGYSQAESAPRSPQSDLSFPPTIAVGTGKGSIHSSGPPPSVLKPEHALRPYREESDDETGYIMGAWQPFQNRASGYIPVTDSGSTSAVPPAAIKSSGFSRVGGGRAHIDSPYAISQEQATGSTHTFPSIGHRIAAQNVTGSVGELSLSRPKLDESPPPSVSSTVALGQRQLHEGSSGLPPGAMLPFHSRKKSQTAIIENVDAVPLAHRPAGSSASNSVGISRPPSRSNRFESIGTSPAPPTAYRRRSATVESDDDSSYGRSKKKWYHLRRSRAHSTEGYPAPTAAGNVNSSLMPPSSTPGKSFVVIRKQQTSPARSLQVASGSGSTPATPTPNSVSFAKDVGGGGT